MNTAANAALVFCAVRRWRLRSRAKIMIFVPGILTGCRRGLSRITAAANVRQVFLARAVFRKPIKQQMPAQFALAFAVSQKIKPAMPLPFYVQTCNSQVGIVSSVFAIHSEEARQPHSIQFPLYKSRLDIFRLRSSQAVCRIN